MAGDSSAEAGRQDKSSGLAAVAAGSSLGSWSRCTVCLRGRKGRRHSD